MDRHRLALKLLYLLFQFLDLTGRSGQLHDHITDLEPYSLVCCQTCHEEFPYLDFSNDASQRRRSFSSNSAFFLSPTAIMALRYFCCSSRLRAASSISSIRLPSECCAASATYPQVCSYTNIQVRGVIDHLPRHSCGGM